MEIKFVGFRGDFTNVTRQKMHFGIVKQLFKENLGIHWSKNLQSRFFGVRPLTKAPCRHPGAGGLCRQTETHRKTRIKKKSITWVYLKVENGTDL